MASTAEQPASQPQPPAKPARPRRLRRWFWRITVFLVGLVGVLAIFFQIVLWTGLPRSIVVGIVEKGLGVRMAASSLSTNWLGHTTLRGVKLALPLSQADQTFLEIPELRVNHTNLVALLCGFDINIKEVDLAKPVLHVNQDASGQWNLSQVAELIMRVAGGKTGQQTASSSAIAALPRLRIDAMVIDIVDKTHREARVDPINVNGTPDTPITWKYDVEVPSDQPNVPPHLSLLGKIAPGGIWAHDAHIWVHDVRDWIRIWQPNFDMPLTLDADWTGQVTSAGVSGFMKISDSQLGSYHADGALAASQSDEVYTVSPRGLRVRSADQALGEIRLPQGMLSYDGKVLKATRLQVAMLSGLSELSGWYEPDINQGAVEAYWDSIKLDALGVTYSGKLNGTYRNPPASNLEINLTANSSGKARDGPFEATFSFNLTGRNWTQLVWRLQTPRLAWHRPQPLVADGLSATGTLQLSPAHQLVRLDSLSLPSDNRLAGTGSYDSATQRGELHLSGEDWPLKLIPDTKLAFVLEATSEPKAAEDNPHALAPLLTLKEFYLRSGETVLSATGSYFGYRPKPVTAEVTFVNRPSPFSVSQPQLIEGYLDAHVDLEGTVAPLKITLSGSVDAQDAMILNRTLGDLHTSVRGGIDYQKAFLRADGIPFLDGIWNLSATYITRQDDNPVYATGIDFSIEHLPLRKLTSFFGAPPVDGILDGRWYIYYPGIKPIASQVIVTGEGQIKNLAASNFVADSVELKSILRDGQFRLDPVLLKRGSYGRIDASAQMDLNNWRQIMASAQLTAFPLDVTPQLALQLNGGSRQIQVLLPDAGSQNPLARQLRVNTDMNLRSSVTVSQQPLGEIRLLTSMHDRTIDIRQLQGNLLGGKVTGDAIVDIDELNQSHANLTWDGLQSGRFTQLYPALRDIGGTLSGYARVAPATDSRPLAPLALHVHLQPTNGHWRTVLLGSAELHAFLDAQTHQFVASDAELNRMQVAGGSIGFWFSGSRHLDTQITPEGAPIVTGITISNQINITLDQLDIDQIVHAFDPKHATGSGRLSGDIFTLSSPRTHQLVEIAQAATGGIPTTSPTSAPVPQRNVLQEILATTSMNGTLQISNSDLGNFAPVAFLYNLMHLGSNIRAPTGRGTVALLMEGGTLHVTNLTYFNRGIEVHGVMTAPQMWNLPDNPIQGSFFGTARPLKNISLPLFAEADSILSQLQLQLSTVEFKGTVANPTHDYMRQLNLAQAGAELRALILGEVSSNPRQ